MRLAGKIKAGYYPTPERVTEMIKSYLGPASDGLIRVYDPCCGYGSAIKTIADHLGAESYGVELENERAAGAKENLTRALHADTFRVAAIKEGFSLAFLNPPYDYDEGERLEHRFLAATHQFLMPNGILVYLIPQHRLYKRTAKLLASWFVDINAYQFPMPEREAFNQIVLFGKKKTQGSLDEGLYGELVAIPERPLPTLNIPDNALYPVPCVPATKGFYFKKLDLDPEDLIEEVNEYGIWSDLWEKVSPNGDKCRVRPVMPLRKGHIAILVATGLADGVLEKNGKRLLVKGTVKKEQIITEEKTDDGIIETARDIIAIIIKALDLISGNIITIR